MSAATRATACALELFGRPLATLPAADAQYFRRTTFDISTLLACECVACQLTGHAKRANRADVLDYAIASGRVETYVPNAVDLDKR